MENHTRCLGCMETKGSEPQCPKCGWVEGSVAASALHLPPGTTLYDKYLLGRVLGQGGFGITYLAWDLNLNLKLAIKEYFPQEMASRATGQTQVSIHTGTMSSQYQYGMDKFLDEARMLARFEDHPNIVSVRDYFQANSTAYLVMSYIEGVTLKELMANHDNKLPVNQAIGIMMPVMDALKELHTVDVLHRDISPDNIYINKKGQVILIDFGAARQAISEQGRALSVIIKPGYAPEEQYRSKGVQGPWTDIYSISATAYHMITGQLPPESLDRLVEDTLAPPSRLGVEINPVQEKALLKALSVQAKDRFQNIAEFQEVLLGRKKLPEEQVYTELLQEMEKEEPEQQEVNEKVVPPPPPPPNRLPQEGTLADSKTAPNLEQPPDSASSENKLRQQTERQSESVNSDLIANVKEFISNKRMAVGGAAAALAVVLLIIIFGSSSDNATGLAPEAENTMEGAVNLLSAEQSGIETAEPGEFFTIARGKMERSYEWSRYGPYSLKIISTDSSGMTHVSARDIDISGLPVGTKHALQVVVYVPADSEYIGQKIGLRYAYFDEEREADWYTAAEFILQEGENYLSGVTSGIDEEGRTELWFAFFFESEPYAPEGSVAYIDGIQVELNDYPTAWRPGGEITDESLVRTENLLKAEQSSMESGDPNDYFTVVRGEIERSNIWSLHGPYSLKIVSTDSSGMTHVSARDIDITGLGEGAKHALQSVVYVPSDSEYIGQEIGLRYAYYDEEREAAWYTAAEAVLQEGENYLRGVTSGIDEEGRTELWFAFFFESEPYAPEGSVAYVDGIQVELNDFPTEWTSGQ